MDPARLGVVARASVLPYRHTLKSVLQIGGELKADYLMEGSLRREGQHVRISAELIRVADQARVWGDDFDSEDDHNQLGIESDLAKEITMKVRSAVFSRSGP
jgi:TolB-like protein